MQAKLLTLCMALCAVCLTATSQNVPDYVPTDGLVAWYPFNGNANDESGNGNDGTVVGASATIDRDGNLNSALEFLGAPVPGTDRTEVAVDNHVAVPNFGEGFENGISISLWSEVYPTSESAFLQRRNNNNIDFSLELNNSQQPGVHLGFMALGSTSSIVNEWTHIALSYDEQTVQLFKNGMLIASEPSTQNINSYDDLLLIGKYIYYGGNTHHFFFNGKQDDIGIWNRALTEEEILALYNAELPIPGCTDSNACNFNPEATGDDGSCIPPGCMEAEACNYNALAECEGEACDYSCCPGPGCCGEGMYWDYEFEQCMVSETCQEDLDGDGVIGVNDLMQLLSVYATDCEAEDVDPELGEFTCGDPMSYHGYDYATVLIGEQCWFAENLRNQKYANGDLIPDNLDDVQWSSTDFGATSIYGEDSSDCYGPCDEIENLDWHGRLYNFEAIQDPRGLCPSGWSPPSETDVLDLIGNYGGVTLAGPDLAAEGAWGVGTGESGLDVVPQGWRNPSGYFSLSGDFYLWTSTEGLPNESSFLRVAHQGSILVDQISQWFGMSARCLKDTEE